MCVGFNWILPLFPGHWDSVRLPLIMTMFSSRARIPTSFFFGDLLVVCKLLPQARTALKKVYKENVLSLVPLRRLHCLQLLNDMLRAAGDATFIGDEVQTVQVALTAFIHKVEQYDSSLGSLRPKAGIAGCQTSSNGPPMSQEKPISCKRGYSFHYRQSLSVLVCVLCKSSGLDIVMDEYQDTF